MDRTEEKKIERRAYAKGYAAGQRKRESAERQRFDAFYCAALTGLLVSGRWRNGDKDWSSIPDYVNGAIDFAKQSLKKMENLP